MLLVLRNVVWICFFAATKLTSWNVLLPIVYAFMNQVVFRGGRTPVLHTIPIMPYISMNVLLRRGLLQPLFYLSRYATVATTVLFYFFYFFNYDAIKPRYPSDYIIVRLVAEQLTHIIPSLYMVMTRPPVFTNNTPEEVNARRSSTIWWITWFTILLPLYQFVFYVETRVPAYPFMKYLYDEYLPVIQTLWIDFDSALYMEYFKRV